MSLLHWFKEHFELLTLGVGGVAGGVKVLNTQSEHSRKIEKLETHHDLIKEDLSEIKGDIKTLLERTKKL
jgi:hypothetical protein